MLASRIACKCPSESDCFVSFDFLCSMWGQAGLKLKHQVLEFYFVVGDALDSTEQNITEHCTDEGVVMQKMQRHLY